MLSFAYNLKQGIGFPAADLSHISCIALFYYIPPLKELYITSHSHSNSDGRSHDEYMVPCIHRERVQCLAQGHLDMWIQGSVQGPSAN